ncbi:hypothetical protein F2P56_000881 [Juglans regia]|uniref:Uncharacterized protein n=1 Tax=Juglans regia TaxID=51240 RepID=A0A833YBQ0_JUGRE|nr:hypothetical protein F2P56_000881 [Juglans regia]
MPKVPESSLSGLSLGSCLAQKGATACSELGGGPTVVPQPSEVEVGEIVDGEVHFFVLDGSGAAQGGSSLGGLPQNPPASPGSPMNVSLSSAQMQIRSWGEELAHGEPYEGAREDILAIADCGCSSDKGEINGEGTLMLFEPCKYSTEGEEAVGEDPTPLSMFPPSISSEWVLKKVEELQSCMGILCVGYEEQFKALIIAIEAGQHGAGSKRDSELKRLTWSINYDGNDGSGNMEETRGGLEQLINEAQNFKLEC